MSNCPSPKGHLFRRKQRHLVQWCLVPELPEDTTGAKIVPRMYQGWSRFGSSFFSQWIMFEYTQNEMISSSSSASRGQCHMTLVKSDMPNEFSDRLQNGGVHTYLQIRLWGFKVFEWCPIADSKTLRVPGGVQHGVCTRLHSFFIIRESIDITAKIVKATNGDQLRST